MEKQKNEVEKVEKVAAVKKGRPIKGSEEAKQKMALVRSKKVKK